jgi:predicted KAP-like P-loop ATPase
MRGCMPSLIWSDKATVDDRLGFQDYRNTLVRVVQNAETPITIGVFGRWGSGKTSLMMMVQKDVAEAGAQTVWFDAWKYDKQDAL